MPHRFEGLATHLACASVRFTAPAAHLAAMLGRPRGPPEPPCGRVITPEPSATAAGMRPSGSVTTGMNSGSRVGRQAKRTSPSRPAPSEQVLWRRFARRQGVGAAILVRLENSAQSEGIGTLLLETGTSQPEALALYHRFGYRERDKEESPVCRP